MGGWVRGGGGGGDKEQGRLRRVGLKMRPNSGTRPLAKG